MCVCVCGGACFCLCLCLCLCLACLACKCVVATCGSRVVGDFLMSTDVRFVNCGDGPKNKLDYVALRSSQAVWTAITDAARKADKFPQNEMWKALDANLPEKSSAVKVVVQVQCLELLEHVSLQEWKRLAKVAAHGAYALFRAATRGWDCEEVYEPFELVGKRSEVTVPNEAREAWQAGLKAHERMIALEDFGTLSPEQLGGLFLLTHTPDNWVKVVESFGFEYWWLRILHLSVERNADLRIGDFSLTKSNARDPTSASMEMAQRQVATIVALKVAIFYKKRHIGAPKPRVTRHDLEQAKRKWLKRPQARKCRRCEDDGVSDMVRVAMNASSLKTLRPIREVLAEASSQRGVLGKRIARLDQVVLTSRAWQRAVATESEQLQIRVMESVALIRQGGGDAVDIVGACTADALHKKSIIAAKTMVQTSGLELLPEDSIWQTDFAQVRKLVAVGAGGMNRPVTIYVRSVADFKRLFGNGSSGECGHRGAARAATVELEALTERLLALVALDFRLRTSTARVCPLPLELRTDLAVVDNAPSSKPPEHVELYHRAAKQQLVALRHVQVFEEATSRAVCHAIRSAFHGCLKLVSTQGTNAVATADAYKGTRPHQRFARNVVDCMLTIAACYDGLVLSEAPDEEAVAIVVYDANTQELSMPCLESAVARVWPAVRLLANVASECEPWLRNPHRRVEVDASGYTNATVNIRWWISCTPTGLFVDAEHKASALNAVQSARTAWWDEWPPSREQITTPETTATAIKWGCRATAAFLGIPKPRQFMGTPPFYGFLA